MHKVKLIPINLALIISTLLSASSLQAISGNSPTAYYYQNNYEYIGSATIKAISSTCHVRTLVLDNDMIFEIAPGSPKWIGYDVTIYRDLTRDPESNYVLSISNYEFRANKLESCFIPTPTRAQPQMGCTQ